MAVGYAPRVSDGGSWTGLGELIEAIERLNRRAEAHESGLGRVLEAVRVVHDEDRTMRQTLRVARESEAYAEAYRADPPLVSVVIPTWNNARGLREVSIPSVLAQTHPEIEIVVTGDASPPEVAEAVASFDEPRIRYYNHPTRGLYSEDQRTAWLSSGTPPFNIGVAMTRGTWIAPLGDDDAFHPDHVERLLARAREERLEFVYGPFARITPDGDRSVVGVFPPTVAHIGLQMAIYPSALSFFELELGDAVFGMPNDWGMIQRMLRAGVRVGMVDEVVTDYFPSMRGAEPAGPADDPPRAPLGSALAARVVALEDRESDLRDEADRLRNRTAELEERATHLEARAVDAERHLRDVTESKSWKLTRPLRGAGARMRRG